MIRWTVAILLILGVIVVLSPIAGRRDVASGPAAPRDILGYRLDPARPLDVEVPAPIEALYITTWAVLEDAACEPVDRHAYGVTASFVDHAGREVGVHELDLVSRRACEGEPNTRLAGSDSPVADHRTIVLRMADVLPNGGRMRLSARPGLTKQVIVMIEARYRRDPYAQRVRELGYTQADRTRIAGKVTSLGFSDLTPSAREEISGAWSRRVDASGIEGQDYVLARLVLRDFSMPLPGPETPPSGFPIGERHFAALNLDGRLALEVAAPEGTRVRVLDPRGVDAAIVLGASGAARLDLPDGPLRTVVLEGEGADVHVQTIVDGQMAALQQIGDVQRRPMPRGRVELIPDLRYVKFASLDPERPVIAHVVGDDLLRIEVRGTLDEADPAESLTIPLEVRWDVPGAGPLVQEITLPRSRFERWSDGADATERTRLLVRAPASARAAFVTGPPWGRIVLKVQDPRVPDLIALPYRVQLQDDEIWRYPPFDLRQWTPVLPENHLDLREDGRWVELREQVRIERPGDGDGDGAATAGAKRPERLLVPEGDPVRRRFFEPAWLAAGEEMPPLVWAPISGSRRVVVQADGPAARRVRLLYRVPAAALGETWTLRAGDAAPRSDRLVVTSGTLDVLLDPGAHLLAVDGPKGATFLADAAPERGGDVMRERAVFELAKSAPLDFYFRQSEGQRLTVVLFVVTEDGPAPWSLRYAVDDGRPSLLVGRFFRTFTVPSGTLSGDGAGKPRGQLWESALSGRGDVISRAKIPIGDDLVPGRRKLRIELDGGASPVWIGAVLVGQAAAFTPSGARAWVEEEE